MENNKELNDLIKDIRSKLPSDVTIELIGDDDIARETQSRPGQALSDELLAKISQAAEAAAREIFGDNLESITTTQLSPVDGSPGAAQLFREMLRNRFGLQRPQCYHYILDSAGNPVHTDDDMEVIAFRKRNGHILAEDNFVYRHLKMKIATSFMIHNPWTGGEPPRPRWVTQLIKDDGDIGAQEITHSADEAMLRHRVACEAMRRQLAEHKQHRFAKGLDAWRRKLEGTDE